MRSLLGVIFLSWLASTATVERGPVPDPKLTPGDTLGATRVDICTPSYTKVACAVQALLSLFGIAAKLYSV
jgi:hypothetical protein